MITAQVESVTRAIDSGEIIPLLDVHYDKLSLHKEKFPLSPQYEVYRQRDASGAVMYIALRDQGKLIGYWIAFINPGLHYSTCLTAMMDIWNLLPGYENGRAALILMRAVEREYKRRGVNLSFIGEKLHKPSGRLFEAFGYKPVETYYSKWIGE
jgi:hypothetical protein